MRREKGKKNGRRGRQQRGKWMLMFFSRGRVFPSHCHFLPWFPWTKNMFLLLLARTNFGFSANWEPTDDAGQMLANNIRPHTANRKPQNVVLFPSFSLPLAPSLYGSLWQPAHGGNPSTSTAFGNQPLVGDKNSPSKISQGILIWIIHCHFKWMKSALEERLGSWGRDKWILASLSYWLKGSRQM